jgi:amidase
MTRRDLLAIAALAAAGGIVEDAPGAEPAPKSGGGEHDSSSWRWEEVSCRQLGEAMSLGQFSAASLTRAYLDRIASIDRAGPTLNAVIELNPDAAAIAAALDVKQKGKGSRGPLHGLPVLVKDNLDSHDRMMTTAGSTALLGSIAPRDSFVVERLRAAGAVLLGKTNLSEWANFRGSRSTSGWSGRGGLTRNPYALDRNPSGSSSGSAVAVAAGFCAAAIGTETNGSIISPCAVCGVVGLKPTVGLVSRAGIIPIAQSFDTAGPIGRCVADVAALLSAIAGTDVRDPATAPAQEKKSADYTQFLAADGLRGAQIGVARQYFPAAGGLTELIYRANLEALREAGATLIDVPAIGELAKVGDAGYQVMLFEFKAGLNAYLAGLGEKVSVRTLADVIAFNEAHRDAELRWFGQETLLRAQEKGPLTEKAYLDALEKCRRYSRALGIDAVMDEQKLDALIAPSGGPAAITDLVYGDRGVGGSSQAAAVAGYPNITVPAGAVQGLPIGLSFFGRAWSEGVLLRLAYAFEQKIKARKAPTYAATLG